MRPHRGLYWSGVLVALLALVGGAVVAYTGWLSGSGPDGAVRQYFAALRRGDAAAALGWGPIPSGVQPLLSDQVLAAQRRVAPITDFGVVAITRTGGSRATVTVTLTLHFPAGDQQVGDDVQVVRHGGDWRLAQAAVAVRFRVARAENRASVLGAAVPTEPVLLFPGALPVEFDTPMLSIDQAGGIVRFSGASSLAAGVDVTPEATTAITKALDADLTACLSSTPAATCPLPVSPERAVPGTLRGTLVGQPAVSLTVAPDGLIQITGTASVTGSWQSLSFDNIASAKTGTITVDTAARVYPGDAVKVLWQVTA